MEDLAPWLLELIDEDEKLARAATAGPWRYNPAKEWHAPEEFAKPPYMRLPGEEFVGAGPLDATIGVAATGPADNPQSMADAAFIAGWDPARVLAECEAKRRMIKMHRPVTITVGGDIGGDSVRHEGVAVCWHCIGPSMQEHDLAYLEIGEAVHWPCQHLRLWTLPYADRPGYREEWKP